MSLVFWHSLGGYPAQVLTQIVADYNNSSEYPVEMIVKDSQNYDTAANEALLATPEQRPRFILAPEYMTGQLQQALSRRKIISVSTLLESDKLTDIAEIISKTFGDHCLPFNPACGVLYINKTLLQKNGLSGDWQPQTLEGLAAVARQMNQSEESRGCGGFTCAWPEAYLVEVVLAQKNHSLLDSEGNYHFAQLTDHIFDLWQLVQEGVFLPPNTGNYDPTRAKFIQGEVAFYMQGSGHHTLIQKEAKEAGFELGCAPLPTLSYGQQDQDKYAFPLGGAAIWVFNTDSTREMQEGSVSMEGHALQGVRQFLNYLASKEVQARLHSETAYVPVSMSARQMLQEQGFYRDHPLHEAVVKQTIDAKVGENSFGIKRADYATVRKNKLYHLIKELLDLKESPEEMRTIITEKLKAFDMEHNRA